MELLSILIAAVLLTYASASVFAQGVDRARLDLGAKVYGSLCTTCHGPSGDLIAGVNLGAGQFKTVMTDLDLMNVIVRGVPGTASSVVPDGGSDAPSSRKWKLSTMRSIHSRSRVACHSPIP